MWNVSSNPLRFDEAVDWFRARIPLGRAEWDQLEERARRRAFTVSGVAQLELLEDVYGELLKAVEDGTDFRDFKKAVGEKLERAWGKKGATRIETIFRTNVQSAYAAGRYRQLIDPDVLRLRPYWMYDAVLDQRTSGLCRGLNGTIRPADDPFWDTHTPPLHFNCRSGLRSLTRRQAEERGVTEAPPAVPPAAGFGSRPDPEAWGRDWARSVAASAADPKWQPAFLGDPPGPIDYRRPERIPTSPLPEKLLPTLEEAGGDAFMRALRASWGGEEVVVRDATGRGVILNAEVLLGHLREGSPDKRERYFSLLPDLIARPFEIWLMPYRSERSGMVVFRKRYIKLYEGASRDRPLLLVVEQDKGAAWTAYTMVPTRLNQLNKQRSGFLVWPRE